MNHTGTQRTCMRMACASTRGRARRSGGFTLIELMVTTFVAAILITIAIPSFQHIIASKRLTTTANKLVGALNMARMEAIKRNADTLFCGNAETVAGTLGAACGNGQPGAVYADGGAGAVQIQAAPGISAASLHLDDVHAIRFDARGQGYMGNASEPYSNTVAQVCSDSLDHNNRITIFMVTGNIVHTDRNDGDCS